MLTCLAFAAVLGAAPMSDVASLAAEVEREARAISAISEPNPDFYAALEDFSVDAMALSVAMRAAGVTADMPCIFRGISEDARARGAELGRQDAVHRSIAMSELRALLDDAILLAPMAAEAVADAQAP